MSSNRKKLDSFVCECGVHTGRRISQIAAHLVSNHNYGHADAISAAVYAIKHARKRIKSKTMEEVN